MKTYFCLTNQASNGKSMIINPNFCIKFKMNRFLKFCTYLTKRKLIFYGAAGQD